MIDIFYQPVITNHFWDTKELLLLKNKILPLIDRIFQYSRYIDDEIGTVTDFFNNPCRINYVSFKNNIFIYTVDNGRVFNWFLVWMIINNKPNLLYHYYFRIFVVKWISPQLKAISSADLPYCPAKKFKAPISNLGTKLCWALYTKWTASP